MPSLTLRSAALLTAALSGALVVGIATPAFAATTEVSITADLLAGGTRTITLDNDVTVTANTLSVEGTATLDLHGFELSAKNISLTSGSTLIVVNVGGGAGALLIADGSGVGLPGIAVTNATVQLSGGTIIASGGPNHAGIGGGGNSGTILIDGATVNATGGTGGAGIGGSLNTGGSNITVSSGTVNAQGGANAAGIGGGSGTSGAGHDIEVSGGTVNAWGGQGFASGAGIGGGYSGSAWNLTFTGGTTNAYGASQAAGIGTGQATVGTASGIFIGVGAIVNATSGTGGSGSSGYPYPSAVGGAENTVSNGAITIDGTLNVFGHFRHNGYGSGAITIGATGVLGGTAEIRGQNGAIVNHGAVTNPNVVNAADTGGGVTITDHSYLVSFVAPDATPSGYSERVYATSFAAGNRSLWTGAVLTDWIFAGWVLPGNTAFTTTSTLSANVTVYATWDPGPGLIAQIVDFEMIPIMNSTIQNTPITAGQTLAFIGVPIDSNGDNLGYLYSGFTLTTTDPDAIISGRTIQFVTAGVHTVYGHIGAETAIRYITVLASPVDDVSLVLSGATVEQYGSLTFAVWTVDAYGNRIANVSSTAVVTSDQPTDVVTGTTVTFPHASPHVITATLGLLSASATVQVSPAALADSGVEPLPLMLTAFAMLLAGAVILRRRRVA